MILRFISLSVPLICIIGLSINVISSGRSLKDNASKLLAVIIISIGSLINTLYTFYSIYEDYDTKTYTKSEVDSLIYYRIMEDSENPISMGDNYGNYRIDTVGVGVVNYYTNLGVYKVWYPDNYTEDLTITTSYPYKLESICVDHNNITNLKKVINSIYKKRLIELLNIDCKNFAKFYNSSTTIE